MQRPKQTLVRYGRRQRFINKHKAVLKEASRFFPEYGSVTVSAGIVRARANVVADGVNKRQDRSYRGQTWTNRSGTNGYLRG